MKITIICGPDGKVLGTARHYAAQGEPVGHLIARSGQTAYEIDLPKGLESIEAADAFHAALEQHLKTVLPKS